jgi:hypothetical protein
MFTKAIFVYCAKFRDREWEREQKSSRCAKSFSIFHLSGEKILNVKIFSIQLSYLSLWQIKFYFVHVQFKYLQSYLEQNINQERASQPRVYSFTLKPQEKLLMTYNKNKFSKCSYHISVPVQCDIACIVKIILHHIHPFVHSFSHSLTHSCVQEVSSALRNKIFRPYCNYYHVSFTRKADEF